MSVWFLCKKCLENEANNFANYFWTLCVHPFLRMQETFNFYLYTSTFFHEATFMYAKLSTYVHTYNAFIKRVKRSDKIVVLRWLVMIFLPLSSLVTTYSHHICMYVSTFTRNIYPVVKSYRVCHSNLCQYLKIKLAFLDEIITVFSNTK